MIGWLHLGVNEEGGGGRDRRRGVSGGERARLDPAIGRCSAVFSGVLAGVLAGVLPRCSAQAFWPGVLADVLASALAGVGVEAAAAG